MAGIDKTYTDSYKDYKEFKDWADNQYVTFFDGSKECIGNWVWDYEKEDFDIQTPYEGLEFNIEDEPCIISTVFYDKKIATIVTISNPTVAKTQLDYDSIIELCKSQGINNEIPIMNSPVWLDAYLIKHCKIGFVLERMEQVHSEEFFKDSKNVDFEKIPQEYKKERKISVSKIKGRTKFPIHNKPYGGKTKWWLQCNDDFSYNYDTKIWANKNDMYYPTYTNTSHVKSLKGVIRHLRKQYLTPNTEFRLIGNYVGEEYLIKIGN